GRQRSHEDRRPEDPPIRTQAHRGHDLNSSSPTIIPSMNPTHRAVLAVLFAFSMTVAGLGQTPVASEVRVFVPDEAALIDLIALDLDLTPHQVDPGWFPVIVYGPDQLSALTAAGFEV